MDKRMIYADELKEKLWFLFKWFGQLPCSESDKITQQAIKKCISEVDKAPTVEAVEVVHGRFELIEKAGVDYWRCSACKEIVDEYYHKPKYNYCPNCGAKMDGDGNDI